MHRCIWTLELRMVQGVERLSTKLEARTFPECREAELLEERQCPRSRPWHAQVRENLGRVANRIRVGHDGHIRICEVLIQIEAARPLQRACQVRTLRAVSRDAMPARQAQDDRLPSIKAPDAICLPAAKNRVHHWIHVAAETLPSPNREFVDIAELKDLGNIELGYGSIRFAIIRLLKNALQPPA